MSDFLKSPWRGEFFEIAPEQSCDSLHYGPRLHRGLVPEGCGFNAPKGSLDDWPRCNIMNSEGNGKCHAFRG
jgi:hypothetical protein